MAQRSLEIDMCAGSQLRDTQGEMLNVEGADIGELESGKGRINDNHGKGFFNVLGKVTMAKKIFKAEDCEDERQTYYWEKVKSPYIYVKAKLFNDEDHPNAKAAAAILRNIHKTDSPLKIKASVEGGVISRGLKDPSLLARTKIHSVALTFVPANQATLVEPLNLDKSEANTEADMILIKSVMHLAKKNVPSFRHITRDAQAERIENNVNKLLAALGTEDAINLKRALIEDSLESKIADNVNKIHQLMIDEVLEKGKKELLAMYKPEHLEAGKQHVAWAQTLPKSNWKEWAVRNHANDPTKFTPEHKQEITHFAGINHPLVRDVPLSHKDSLDEGLQKLRAGEEAYKEKFSQKRNLMEPEGQKISHYGHNKGWFDLKRPYCEKEAAAMGHCGNVEGQGRTTDNILSFRHIAPNGKHEPHLTFIENNGWLGETKGRANEKPNLRYHQDIAQLLKNPRIKGIAGGGYAPGNNFEFSDLNPQLQQEVMEANPNFIPQLDNNTIKGAISRRLPSHHITEYLRNHDVDPAIHDQLINHEDPNIRYAVAQYPDLDPKHHEKLVNDKEGIVREAIAHRPDLDPKYHEQLVNDEEGTVREAIAHRPDLDPKHHEKLVNDESAIVRQAVAKRPDLDPKHHEQLINDEEGTVREAIAHRPDLDPKYHEQLVNDKNAFARRAIAQRPDLDPKHHEKLINDESATVRQAVAKRPDLDPKHHEKLVNDESAIVRQAIAQRPDLDPKHHEKLINDEEGFVREALSANPKLAPKLLNTLIKDKNPHVRLSASKNPNLDPKHHESLVNNESPFVRGAIGHNPNLDPKYHKQLVNDDSPVVRVGIAQNPNLDPEYHERLINDNDLDTRWAMIGNRNLSPKHHEQFVNHDSPEFRAHIGHNHHLSLEHQQQLANDSVPFVRESLTYNPKVDTSILKQLVNDEDGSVKYLAKKALANRKQQDDTATDFAHMFQKAINELRQGIIMDNLPENKIEEYIAQIYEQLEKALSAGYGGAGMPTGLTGGGVLQSESQELGPKNLSFITCDGCGKEQVYGKHQVKCRDCGKAFSMAKLEKFFSLQKSKQNTPEQQAKIDQFMQRKAAGQPTHDTRNEGTMGHLPPQTPGTFHGQGATTSGKIVNKRFSYEKKGTDERGFGQAAQQEKHHWWWDHGKKKWNYIRTTRGSPNLGGR